MRRQHIGYFGIKGKIKLSLFIEYLIELLKIPKRFQFNRLYFLLEIQGAQMPIIAYSTVAQLLTLYISIKFCTLVWDPARALLKGLVYYLPPSTGSFQGILPKEHKRKPNPKKKAKQPKFVSSRRHGFPIIQEQIDDEDLYNYQKHMIFLDEFSWLLQLTLQSIFVNLVAVTWNCLAPGTMTFDLGNILLAYAGASAVYLNLKLLYLRGISKFDVRTTFFAGIVGGVVAYVCLLMQADMLDFRLALAMPDFNRRWKNLTAAVGTPSTKADEGIDAEMFRLPLAIAAGLITSASIIPMLRITGYFNKLVESENVGACKSFLLNVNFFAPLFLALLWIPPLTSDFVLSPNLMECEKDLLIRDCSPFPPGKYFVNESMYNGGRILVVMAYALLSLCILRTILQVHLSDAMVQVQYVLNSVSNIDDAMINRVQYGIQQIFLRTCVVGVQYLGPVVFVFTSSVLLQKKGEHNTEVCAVVRSGLSKVGWEITDVPKPAPAVDKGLLGLLLNQDDAETKQIMQWLVGVSSSQVFTGRIFRPVIGFLLWWALLSTFCVSAIGLVYHRRKRLFANVSRYIAAVPGSAEETTNSKEWKAAQKKFK
jgi:hypothetical protein